MRAHVAALGPRAAPRLAVLHFRASAATRRQPPGTIMAAIPLLRRRPIRQSIYQHIYVAPYWRVGPAAPLSTKVTPSAPSAVHNSLNRAEAVASSE